MIRFFFFFFFFFLVLSMDGVRGLDVRTAPSSWMVSVRLIGVLSSASILVAPLPEIWCPLVELGRTRVPDVVNSLPSVSPPFSSPLVQLSVLVES